MVNGITQYSYSNVAQAETKGIETTAQWHISTYLAVSGAYTYTEAKDKTTNKWLTRRPKHIARIGADYSFNDQLDLTLRARYQSEEFGDSANLQKSPDWFSIDTQIDYQVSPYISAFIGINNILNQQRDFNASVDYRPIEGRYSYTGLRFNWNKKPK